MPLNSTLMYAGQPKTVPQNLKAPNMETPDHNPDIAVNTDLYTIEWSDIENAEMDYENYLNDIENFFKDYVDEEMLKEDHF